MYVFKYEHKRFMCARKKLLQYFVNYLWLAGMWGKNHGTLHRTWKIKLEVYIYYSFTMFIWSPTKNRLWQSTVTCWCCLNWLNTFFCRSTDDDGISYGLLIDTTQQLRLCDSNVASYIHKRLFSYPETAYCVWHSVQRQLYKSKQTYAKC